MRVVDPIKTTDSNFVNSTIQEPDQLSGEKEWVNTPFYGYDISAEAGSPAKVINGPVSDIYYVWDSSSDTLRFYDMYFNYLSSRQIHSAATVGFEGVTTFAEVVSIALDSDWSVYSSDRFSDTKIEDAKPILNSAGILSITPVGLFFARDLQGTQSHYLLNKETSSKYVVIKFNRLSVEYQSILDTSTYGTPRDITQRDGKYLVLFSDASKTTVVEYEEDFATVVSVNEITGNTVDQPYDSITINFGTGYELLKTSTMKIYSVDSSFNRGASYKAGSEVVKAAIHKKYRALTETVQDPEIGVNEVPPTWVEVGATNRWAMFDGANTYQSIYGSDVEIEIRPIGVISSICAFNIENVDSVEITTSVPDTGSSYTETFDTTGKDSLVTYDLPPYENPFVTIKFFGTDIKVGEVVMGQGTELGVLLAGAVSDRIDYSRYTYDEFGELTYVPRPIVNYTTYPIRVAKIDALGIERYLDNLKGKQAVWIGNIGDGQHLVTRGTIERSPMTYDTPSVLEYLIKVRGSI